MIVNFNIHFMNYSYLLNFYYLNEYINYFNNEFLENFSKSFTFEEKTKNIMKYLFSVKNKITKSKDTEYYYLDCEYSIGNGILKGINDKYYIEYSYKDKKISLNCCEDNFKM